LAASTATGSIGSERQASNAGRCARGLGVAGDHVDGGKANAKIGIVKARSIDRASGGWIGCGTTQPIPLPLTVLVHPLCLGSRRIVVQRTMWMHHVVGADHAGPRAPHHGVCKYRIQLGDGRQQVSVF
jgi:hypothetical protein